MKSLISDRIIRNNEKIKEEAKKSKRLIANNKNEKKHEQIKEIVVKEKQVMKESKTLMID